MTDQTNVSFASNPAYLFAADNHNLGNNSVSWFSPSNVIDSLGNVPKFLASSVLSGVNSFYNTGIAVGNWFGADAQFRDTGAWISDIDSDLGAYYNKNRQSTDLIGFIATSFIPGIAGMKALSAGQAALRGMSSGMAGVNSSRALGLLTPSPQYYVRAAQTEIAQSQVTFSSINANTLRAISSGYGEAALQSAAFEIAVVATMFKSPVLDDMDGLDLAKNIAIGTGLGSFIGGSFTAAKSFGQIRKVVREVDNLEKPFTLIDEPIKGMSAADRIIARFNDLNTIPDPKVGAALVIQKLGADTAKTEDFVKKFTRLKQDKEIKLQNLILADVRELTGDEKTAEVLYNSLRGLDNNQILANLLGAEQVVKLGQKVKLESDLRKEFKISSEYLGELEKSLSKKESALQSKLKNVISSDNIEKITDQFTMPGLVKAVSKFADNLVANADETGTKEIAFIKNQLLDNLNTKNFPAARQNLENLGRFTVKLPESKAVSYVKLWGDDAGRVTFESPKTARLADTVKDVKSFVDNQRFDSKKSVAVTTLSADVAEARYIWASQLKNLDEGVKIHEYDIPLLERAYELKVPSITVIGAEGTPFTLNSAEQLHKFIQISKEEIANYYQKQALAALEPANKIKDPVKQAEKIKAIQEEQITVDDISRITNLRKSYLEGVESVNPDDDLFARQFFERKYTEDLISKGLWQADKGTYSLWEIPSYIKVATRKLETDNIWELKGMAYIKAKEKLLRSQMDNVLVKHMGEFYNRFFEMPEEAILTSNRYGSGSGVITFANGNYGSMESMVQSVGASTNAWRNSVKEHTRELFNATLVKAISKSEPLLEFSAINRTIASTIENYVLDVTGTKLINSKYQTYLDAIKAGKQNVTEPVIQQGAPIEIAIKNEETRELVRLHIQRNGERVTEYSERRAVQGLETSRDPRAFYPLKPDPKDYPHFFFVVDPKITSEAAGRVTMVHATSPKELEALRERVPSEYKVVLEGQSEEYHKALGDYEFERTLHESYINSDLKRRGINSQFFPATDPKKIADDLLNWHLRQDDINVRDAVWARYEKEFAELERLGEQYTGVSLSRYAYDPKYSENVTKNPYFSYIKTALDISNINEYPLLVAANRMIDSAFSRAMQNVNSVFNSIKSPEELDKVNKALQEYGIKTAYYDAALDALANHTAPKGALTKFVNQANALLATTILRLDPLNATNNAVGASVLLGTETKSVIRAIKNANPQIAGKLANLMTVSVPGMEERILAPGKLIANAYRDWVGARHGKEALQTVSEQSGQIVTHKGKTLIDQFKENGWITDLTAQFHRMIDDLTLQGTESVSDLNSRIQRAYEIARKIGDKGEGWTGNTYAEEMNRFVAAHVMKQITDEAVGAGVLSAKEQIAYINTFVNRTQGNILASQRPLIFQGPIGQAIGLFQTYQFNLLQQMFRYVSEGTAKDAAMLLGLQGTIYGLNGLPAFNFINTHIVGTASGNQEHKDFYSSLYGIAGKETAEFLLYGLPSNLLATNLFTRGDINPRYITVIPVNPMDTPIVGAYGKFFASMQETISKMANGGDIWNSFLSGIEHNGLSRPLAGLAQTLRSVETGQVYSTTSKGNIAGSNDLFSLATMARLAGGRPFDEAVALDHYYRFRTYAAHDRAKQLALGETFKTHVIGNKELDPEVIMNFAQKYAERGGDQANFNRWMTENIKNANTSQVNKIAESLSSPFAQRMQEVMGGMPYLDGRNF